MLGMASSGTSCFMQSTVSSRSVAPAVRQAVQHTPRRRRQTTTTSAFGGAMSLASDSFSTASTIATAIGVALGAGFVAREVMIEEARAAEAAAQREDACPTCHGSGYEPCACRRWSDGDVGCSSCCRTGMMVCRSCRGGGTAVPIRVTVRKH